MTDMSDMTVIGYI